MNRAIFLLHRYLGIVLGLLLLVWCLSGIVMMYVQFPEFSEQENLRGLDPLDLSNCCLLPSRGELAELGRIETAQIEMLADRPVMRLNGPSGDTAIDLTSSEWLRSVNTAEANAISASFAKNLAIENFEPARLIERDQWTVYGAFNRHRPLFKYVADDAVLTQWYVSSRSGEVVQLTTQHERFWNWLGAVPHWLYPTILRQNTLVWSRVVIWSTILGVFLTVLGLYVGIRQYRTRRNGRYSPYRGAALWHHYAGLIFGVLTLTWLVSGFFSMNPWGVLESRSFAAEIERHRGPGLVIDSEFFSTVASLRDNPALDNVVRLEAATVRGERYFIAWDSLGQRERYKSDLSEAGPIELDWLAQAAKNLRPEVAIAEVTSLEKDDAYYYSHHEELEFPVFRVTYVDDERYYFDSVTGDIVYAVDDNRRMYRWLHYGLHRGDFSLIRSRPVWDILMLILMVGVTIGAFTGSWLGIRRIRRSLRKSAIKSPGRTRSSSFS